ncbi:MAG: phosphate signaling complex protein PhoU [Alphaproteobacteria bacterium]|nr:phosphate signaling complex protein PhoU [Alphaproteobacteria bacterium]
MANEHTVKSFEEELKRLTNLIARMGGMVETQIATAIQSVVKRDADLAATVVQADVRVDELEREIDDQVLRVMALRQPVASDLRLVLGALRIGADLERAADYAKNVAKRAGVLAQVPPLRPVHSIPRMGAMVREMLKDVLDAFAAGDVVKAVSVWNRDEELDEMYASLFRELLTYMMEDPRNISGSTHLLFIAKNIERIGDHTTNIAETIHFLVKGVPLRDIRPKGDVSSFAIVGSERGDGTGSAA